MKFSKKTVAIVCSVVLGVTAVGFGVTSSKNKAKQVNSVETVNVEVVDNFSSSIEVDGIVKSKQEVSISPDISTKIVEVFFNEGAMVKKGDVLARLDTKDILNKISSAEVSLSLEKERLNSLQSELSRVDKVKTVNTFELEKNVENSKINLDIAKDKFEKSKQLYDAGAISKDQLDIDERAVTSASDAIEIAENRLKEARDNTDSADAAEKSREQIKGNIEVQKKSIELQELSLKREREALENTVIRSPIDGAIVTSNAKLGITPQAGSPLFTISSVNNLEVEVKVGEYDISNIVIGQGAEITGDAFKDKALLGKISYIAPSIGEAVPAMTDGKTTGSKESKIVVKIELDEIYDSLKPGYNVNAIISTSVKDKAMVVPYESIYKNKDDEHVVFLVGADNKVKEIPIETGIAGDIKQEIISDKIKKGDKIILTPDENTKSGMIINLDDNK